MRLQPVGTNPVIAKIASSTIDCHFSSICSQFIDLQSKYKTGLVVDPNPVSGKLELLFWVIDMTELDTRFSFDQHAAPHTLCQSLFNFLLEQQPTFEQQLTPDLSHIDSQAHTLGRPKLLRVEHIHAHHFHLYYQIKWQFFHGCSDKSDSGVSEEKVRFSLRSPCSIDIHFPIHPQRDTQDEF